MHLLDEVAQHSLGGVEVCDDTVLQRTDRDDVSGRTANHLLGVCADCEDAAGVLVDRDNRRLVQHDAAAADIDKGVGGSEVDRHVTADKRHVAHEEEASLPRRGAGRHIVPARPPPTKPKIIRDKDAFITPGVPNSAFSSVIMPRCALALC